jgi:hypothetical protein
VGDEALHGGVLRDVTLHLSARTGAPQRVSGVFASMSNDAIQGAMPSRIFIAYHDSAYPNALRSAWLPTAAVASLERHLQHPRNARSETYMRELVTAAYGDVPESAIVRVTPGHRLPSIPWESVSEVVLLWPDGNGLGWGRLEREVFRRKRPSTRITVLNGRRRSFVLNRGQWRTIRVRRFIEKSLVTEAAFTVVFAVTSPFLLAWDMARGRR